MRVRSFFCKDFSKTRKFHLVLSLLFVDKYFTMSIYFIKILSFIQLRARILCRYFVQREWSLDTDSIDSSYLRFVRVKQTFLKTQPTKVLDSHGKPFTNLPVFYSKPFGGFKYLVTHGFGPLTKRIIVK